MGTIERNKINKLRRRLALSLLCILTLIVWVKSLYEDNSNLTFDVKHLNQSLLIRDAHITTLSKKIDSLKVNKPVIQKVVEKKPIRKIKPLLDTLKIKTDTLPKDTVTLTIDSISK